MKRTALARDAALVTKTQLRRATGRTRQTRQRPTKPSKTPAASTDIPQAVRDAVAARSGGDCEATIGGVCLGRATNIHHRRRRNIQPAHTLPNLLHLCGSGTTGCHGWITTQPKLARQYGWIVSSYHDPAPMPARVRGRMVLLTEVGGYQVDQRTGWPS